MRMPVTSAARETRTLSIQNGLLGQNNGTGSGVNIIKNFLNDESAATAIEYGLARPALSSPSSRSTPR
jgi:hypothetical protein